MNRFLELARTDDLVVFRFDHPPHEEHCDPESEVSDGFGIAFVEAGSFDVTSREKKISLHPGSVFLTHPGFAFRCRHRELCPTDVCLGVGFALPAAAPFERAWMRAGWWGRRRATPLLATVRERLTLAYLERDAFGLERWALATLGALDRDAHDAQARGPYAPRPRELDAVVAVCRAIEADPTARRSIASRAREVGLTSASLTRAFRRYLAFSPHQYVLNQRLAVAAHLLDEGASVSASCYGSGYENLSHFSRSFVRAFGTRASRWRQLKPAEKRRKVQDILARL